MYYGFVQQSGMYETMDLVILDVHLPEYSDYYKNSEQWYLSKSSESLKEIIEHLWFVFNDKEEVQNIKAHIEESFVIGKDTIKIMFAERFII